MVKGFYAVKSPQFTGIVRSNKEYKALVEGKKKASGKHFAVRAEAEAWLGESGKSKKTGATYYAVYCKAFQGIVTTVKEYKHYTKRYPDAKVKKFTTKKLANKWLNAQHKTQSHSELASTMLTALDLQPPLPTPEAVIYVDGGFKDGLGKYGIVAYSSRNTERVYRNFGYVYDQNFNDLKNVGAELMATLRALEWAYANELKAVHILYDFEGIADLIDKAPQKVAIGIYQQIIARFQSRMSIHFLHIRHGNKALHREAHTLTQLVV
ncbi:MAG: viroplasmin family protein [Solibacillus sp.]